jgi:MoaA/NifB/PqqE/SkfB family radical SAM enzyme
MPVQSQSDPNCGECEASECRLVRFLVRRPKAEWAFTKICRSALADKILGLAARAVIAWNRHKNVDYKALVEGCSCTDRTGPQPMSENIDHDFLCGIMDRELVRAKLPGFLKRLEELDFGVRAGLLKTWIHTGVVNDVLREVRFLAPRENGRPETTPIDALLAPFGRCNLHCLGCYANKELGQESTIPARLDYIVRQLKQLNVHHVLLVGKGEPFYDDRSRAGLFAIVRKNPQMFFSVYTNGTMLLPSDMRQLRKLPNLISILSIDGPEDINDWRRGKGVYRKVVDCFKQMQDHGLLFGYICTVFRQNCQAVLDPKFVKQLIDFGCRLGYYSLFIDPDKAAEEGNEHAAPLMLDGTQRATYFQQFELLDAAVSIPLIDLDKIEAHVGCRAKRGATIYIDAITGRVSPCIRTPLDSPQCNIYHPAGPDRLAQIIQSEPFRKYRQDRTEIKNCEAFINAEKVQGLQNAELIL